MQIIYIYHELAHSIFCCYDGEWNYYDDFVSIFEFSPLFDSAFGASHCMNLQTSSSITDQSVLRFCRSIWTKIVG